MTQKFFSLLCATALMLGGCQTPSTTPPAPDTSSSSDSASSSAASLGISTEQQTQLDKVF